MKIIGLLGGVASGKSFVAQALVRRGGVWLDADKAGHEVLLEPHIKSQLVARWSNSILDPQTGEIDRKAVARIVFEETPQGAAELKWLESLTHPEIRKRLENQLSELRVTNCPLAILDAPVMLKSGWDSICDHVIYVHAPQEVRLKRAIGRGWTAQQFLKREAAQETLAIKRARADFVIDNSQGREYTERELDQLWPRLLK